MSADASDRSSTDYGADGSTVAITSGAAGRAPNFADPVSSAATEPTVLEIQLPSWRSRLLTVPPHGLFVLLTVTPAVGGVIALMFLFQPAAEKLATRLSILTEYAAVLLALLLTAAVFVYVAAIGWSVRRYANWRAMLLLERHGNDFEKLFAAPVLHADSRQNFSPLHPLLNELVRRSHIITARMGWKLPLPAVVPLEYPIEPLRLDERDPAIQELVRGGDHSTQLAGDAASAGAAKVSPPRVPTLSVSKRVSRRRRAGITMLVWIVVYIALMLSAGMSVRRLMLPVAIWALIAAGQLGLFGMLSQTQGFLVPGGLAIRRARWLDRTWRVHLFRRSESVLAVWPARRKTQGMLVSVVDRSEKQTFLISEFEAAALLRAWLSPLPPPPVERLTDLH